jgi:2-polyprenyl-3-methyl-5-hydroxy-6-metoxy-1,4-benzoquinol methylase
MNKIEELNTIAKEYHLNNDIADKFIEDACQEYCCDWLESLINENHNVLELGYGEGHTCNRLSKKTKTYSIIEGSSDLLDEVKSKHPEVNLIDDLFEEYQPANPYDLILALHVFEHVDDPVALAKHMKSWLTEDGEMVVLVPNKESLHRRLAQDMGLIEELGELSARDKLVGHQKVYSLSELEQDFTDAGYEILSKKGFFIKPLPNSMMLDYSPELIYALNNCGQDVPANLLANIALVVRVK